MFASLFSEYNNPDNLRGINNMAVYNVWFNSQIHGCKWWYRNMQSYVSTKRISFFGLALAEEEFTKHIGVTTE